MREESGQTSSQVLTRETIEGLSDAMSGEPAGVCRKGRPDHCEGGTQGPQAFPSLPTLRRWVTICPSLFVSAKETPPGRVNLAGPFWTRLSYGAAPSSALVLSLHE